MSKFEYVGEGDDGFGFDGKSAVLAKVAGIDTASLIECLSGEVLDMSRNQIIARVNELAARDAQEIAATISEIIDHGNKKERANMETLKNLLA